ncbi:efflux RND transporter permease subunit [Maribacter polysiphoniae]|uniref:Efflux RND transporter permease subunit n=1 Tax=Maribacter polysiphoniae TaxID=429344 RepID=A0A316DYB6_9FLAO|nr:efflux RND transporter permease subunit [Maribacter polysiphoniae]MBD1262216.1 efflux RND transporter permease subunit [Maribacter polysiphoniae]PWK21523.1 multidrug efflux pump subunit AcrB [Maribacter polysiphoniae]
MKKVKINFIEAAMKYREVTIVFTLLLMVFGLYALFTMPRSEDPEITVRKGLVIAAYPGADELQVEQQLTAKIEQYLFSFEEVKKDETISDTKAGQVVITVELNENVKDNDRFWATLQNGLNTTFRMNYTLPNGMVGPIVNSNFGDVVAQMITVSAPGRNYAEIESYLDKLEDGLKTINETSKINRYGEQKEQIYVTLNNEKLKQCGVNISNIAQIIQTQNATGYAGEIKLQHANANVFAKNQYKNATDLGNQIIYSDPKGKIVRLKDLATIERRYEEEKSYIQVDNQRVTMLSVEMQPGNNIVKFGEKVEEKIGEIKQHLPQDVQIKTIVNQPEVVKESINHFMLEFIIAISAVIVVVILLLPFRVAVVSALACPIAIVITFGILNMLGIEIHQVSLAALIIVLGMVVDNAIVVVDNYIEKLDEGLDRWTAAWQAATQLMVPIFTATLAIIFAFLPLALFLNGLAKEFIQSLPIAVAIALFTSFLVALLLTPYMCYVFIRKGLKHKVSKRPPKLTLLDRLQMRFNNWLDYSFRYPKTTLAIGTLSIVLAFIIAGNTEQELFPTAERNQFNIEVWLPNGYPLKETEKVVNRIEEDIRNDERIVTIASFVGTSSPRFHTTYAPEVPRENFAQIFITTVGNDETDELAQEYLKKFNGYVTDGYIRVRQLALKESPAPIEVRIVGEDMTDQKKVAEQVKTILENAEGTNWTRTTYQDDYFGIKVNLDDNKANRVGVTNAMVSQTLAAGLSGYPVSTLYEGDKPVAILLRLDVENRNDIGDIGEVSIPTLFGTKIPLKEIASISPEWHTGVIARRNGLRTLTVQTETQMGIKASTIMKKIKPAIDDLELPEGTTLHYGGEYESSAETMPHMATSLAVSLVLIFLVLLFQFKNFTRVLIVLATFPLSILGAFLGLQLTGNPFGFTAFMGVISLIGIVVRNGIILVDYADELAIDHNYSIKGAAKAAGKRRMRPIFLTSAAAAVGVIPMIIGKSPLWAPLGSVLAVGLIVSMVLTLFIIPILYFKFAKKEYPRDHARPTNDEILYKPNHFSKLKMKLHKIMPLLVFFMVIPFSFGQEKPLSLENVKALALKNNKEIVKEQYNLDAANAAQKATQTADKPFLDASAMGIYLDNPPLGLLPDYTLYSSLGVSQVLYAGGKVNTAKKLAKTGVALQTFQKQLTQSNVLLQVENTYWQLVNVKGKVDLAQKYQKLLNELLNDLTNLYDAGLTYKNDLLKVQVESNQAELNLITAYDNLQILKLQLAQLAGLPNTNFEVDGSTNEGLGLVEETLIDTAVENRAEIAMLQNAVELGELQTNLLQAERKPTLGISFSGSYLYGDNLNATEAEDHLTNFVGLASLNIPIFDWGGRKQKVKEQRFKVEAQKTELDRTKELVAIEIQNAYLEMHQAIKRVEIAKKSMEQADENLKLHQDRFDAGTINGSDVLEAQVLWQKAYSDLIDAKANFNIRKATYVKSIGELNR